MQSNNATTIRMDDYTKAIVDSAAKASNQTRSAFIISTLREKAEQVVKERVLNMRKIAPLVLDAEDSKLFLEALEQEFKPTQALLDLKKHHDLLNIVDRS